MNRLAPLLVALVSGVVFANAAPDVAIHDDKFFAPGRFHLDAGSLGRMFSGDSWAITGSSAGLYRPLLLFSFAIDDAISETSARACHVTNIVLHSATATALYALLLALLRHRSVRDEPLLVTLAAAGAALVFGVHPIHTEAVDSIFNRSEILVALGTVMALWVIQRWHEHRPALAWTSPG